MAYGKLGVYKVFMLLDLVTNKIKMMGIFQLLVNGILFQHIAKRLEKEKTIIPMNVSGNTWKRILHLSVQVDVRFSEIKPLRPLLPKFATAPIQ